MAVFYVSHHKYPKNPQVFLVDLELIITKNSVGEGYWHIVFNTSGMDSEGSSLGPYYYNFYGSEVDIDSFIEDKITSICNDIDWERSWYGSTYSEEEDHTPPKIVWQSPEPDQEDVPIASTIGIRLKDLLPSDGIDLSSLQMSINGISVTPKIVGHKYDCVVFFSPVPVY